MKKTKKEQPKAPLTLDQIREQSMAFRNVFKEVNAAKAAGTWKPEPVYFGHPLSFFEKP